MGRRTVLVSPSLLAVPDFNRQQKSAEHHVLQRWLQRGARIRAIQGR